MDFESHLPKKLLRWKSAIYLSIKLPFDEEVAEKFLNGIYCVLCQPCPLGSFSCICQQWPVWLVDGSIGRPLCTLAVPHLPKSVMWNNTMVVQTGYSYFIIRSENVQKHAKTCISNFLDPIQKCLSSRSLQLEAIVGIVFSLRLWG